MARKTHTKRLESVFNSAGDPSGKNFTSSSPIRVENPDSTARCNAKASLRLLVAMALSSASIFRVI